MGEWRQSMDAEMRAERDRRIAQHEAAADEPERPDAIPDAATSGEWAERFRRDTGVYADWEQIERLCLPHLAGNEERAAYWYDACAELQAELDWLHSEGERKSTRIVEQRLEIDRLRSQAPQSEDRVAVTSYQDALAAACGT